ncbi:putative inactive metalloprotease YmfF [Pullulanibacillus camelliae]|uniref:Putative inactive metalloprotease YmfF n=1 Tax=Pullulanibacillus camelliae TaxID=1707096 RepID=A0A8J3DWA2_9BACL|nr:pitrilysin family protein [Pullulanibacillus camelliae]GGE46052.1 putative inactive metalloprotease YmfF [Pullulanibacillus camelliae]
MNTINEEIVELAGYRLHIVKTNKFKTVTMVLQFCAPLEESTVTKRALLAHLLKSSTKKSPTSQQLQHRLDDLYGASLASQVQKKGHYHVLSIQINTANEKFLSESSSLLTESLHLLAEAVLEPNVTEQGAFDEAVFQREKRALRQRLLAVYDDKMRYASERLIDEMCAGEPFALHTNGTLEALEALTPTDVYDYYLEMLKTNSVDLYIVGDVDSDVIQSELKTLLHFNQNEHRPIGRLQDVDKRVVEPKYIKESQDIEQGKLNLGYRTHVVVGDPLYPASQVFNGLFGGFPHSKLFMNVREKASLAYYAVSRNESFKGLMLVMSGIEFANYDQALDIIHEQFKAMQEGAFSDHEIDQTKALLINSTLEALDSPFSVIDLLYQQVLSNDALVLDEWFDDIHRVNREDIIKVAQQTQLDTVYFLQGKERA